MALATESSLMPDKEVPIKIDKTNLKVDSPATGSTLYSLGNVTAEYDLYLEVPGPSDDQLIANDSTPYDLKPGSHFYTVKKTLNPGNA